MKINYIQIAIFALGIIIPSVMMLRGRWEKGDWKLIAISFGLALIGLIPARNEDNYDIRMHLLYTCFLGALWFTANFRKRLVLCIGARSLIIFNAVLIYLAVGHFNVSSMWFLVICVPSILTLINGFTDIDKYYFWQVFFHVWFLCMIVMVSIFYFSFENLMNIFGFESDVSGIGYLQSFVLGSAFLYIVSNVWFLIELIPWPAKHQTFANRIIEVKKHMQLLAFGYIWQDGDRQMNLLVLIFVGLILFLNYNFSFTSEINMVSLALVISPIMNIFDKKKKIEDGIGTI